MTPQILYIHTLLAVIWGHAPIYREHWANWAGLMGVSANQARAWFEKGTIPASSIQRLADNLAADLGQSSLLSRIQIDDPMLHFLKVQRAFQKWLEGEVGLVITYGNVAPFGIAPFGTVTDLYDDFITQHLHKTL